MPTITTEELLGNTSNQNTIDTKESDNTISTEELFGNQQPKNTQSSSTSSERPSILAQLVRSLMRNSPLEQLKTSQYLYENQSQIPSQQPNQSLAKTVQSIQPILQPREEAIARQGTIAQLDAPITAGLSMAGVNAPLQTIKSIGKFGILESLANLSGLNKTIQNIKQPELRDITDIAKIGVEGALATRRWIPTKDIKQLDFELRNISEKELSRAGIKPSSAEAKTFGNVAEFYNKAKNALSSIYEAKDNLKYVYPDGTQTSGLPRNLNEFSQAIPQVKKLIYDAYNMATTQATGQGVVINTENTAKTIFNEISKIEREILDPSLQNYALELAKRLETQKTIDPITGQKLISEVNTTLNNYYKHPSEELRTKSFVDAIMAKDIRKQLDSNIQSATGVQYQQLKNKYGELASIEKYVNRIMLRTKDKTAGMIDFVDTFGTADILRGIIQGNLGDVVGGTAIKGTIKYFKNLNEPNARISNLFRQFDKIEGLKTIKNKLNDWHTKDLLLKKLLKIRILPNNNN